jgi:hypothetical protein
MSLKMANRITTPAEAPKSQNLTTEERGRTNVLVGETNFVTAADLGNSLIESLNV